MGDGLPEMQERVVRALLEAERSGLEGLTQKEICEAMGMDPKADRTKITNYLQPLIEKKRFVERVSNGKGKLGHFQKLYRTTKSAKVWASLEKEIDIQETT